MSASSLAVCSLSKPETQNSSNKQKVGLASLQASGPCSTRARTALATGKGSAGLRAGASRAGLWPPHIPAAAPQQTPSRALSSANWSCEFEQKGNCVS